MSKRPAWLLTLVLLASTSSQAALRLVLDAEPLDAAQRQASQALLDEASAALPPLFVQRLDRDVPVRWTAMPTDIYGRAGRFSGIELNAGLLPALT
ncbi:MAG TPA: hypothetical protein VN156_13060, partial [Pseudomonas sp.]|nr:hypothetical protein [Pseudomonas sp.]